MIVAYETLPDIRKAHEGQDVVFTGGIYDLVHEGHVEGLEYRKSLGDVLVVGVVSDERVRERKGPSRPIRSQAGRLAVVNAFRAVDYAFIMPLRNEDTPTMQVIQTLRPDILADYDSATSGWKDAQSDMERMGIKLAYDEGPKRDSTTDIVARVLESFTPR